jgi:hypothetical protein
MAQTTVNLINPTFSALPTFQAHRILSIVSIVRIMIDG